MAKRSKTMNGLVIALILLAVAIGFMVYQNQGLTAARPSDRIDTGDDVVCTSEVSPSITFKAFDKYNKGTAISGNFIYREQGQTSWSNSTLSSAVSLDVGKTYEVVYGITTSDFVDEPYGPYFTYTVPCRETDTVEKEMTNDELEGSMTATFYNADANADAETFSAGVSQTVAAKISAGSDEEFGNRYIAGNDKPNVICLNLNKTAWDVPDFVRLRSTGEELSRVSTPLLHSVGTAYTAYCYNAPVFTEMDTYIDMRLNPDDSNAPVNDDTMYIYAASHYIDDDSSVMFGVETEEGADVAISDPDSLTLDFS